MILKIISSNDPQPTDKEKLAWLPHEITAFKTMIIRRQSVGRIIELFLGTSDEGDPYASIVFTDNGITCMHICRAGEKYQLTGDSRQTLIVTLDDLLNSVDICRGENLNIMG